MKQRDPPTCAWGSGSLDTLHGPRSHSSDCRAISETGQCVHTCRPPDLSCRGPVRRCGAKHGRGVRLSPRPWGERTVPGAPNSHFYNPHPTGHPALTHTGVPLRSVPKPGGG